MDDPPEATYNGPTVRRGQQGPPGFNQYGNGMGEQGFDQYGKGYFTVEVIFARWYFSTVYDPWEFKFAVLTSVQLM